MTAKKFYIFHILFMIGLPIHLTAQNYLTLLKTISGDTIWKQGVLYQPQSTDLTIQIKAFGSTDTTSAPVDVYFVIDHSNSMTNYDQDPTCTDPRRVDYANAAAQTFIDSLSSDDRAAILYFWGDPKVTPWPFQPLTNDKAVLNNFLQDKKTVSGTYLREAIIQACDYMKATPHNGRIPVIIALTDGNQSGGMTKDTTTSLNAITSAYNSNIRTYGIALGSNEPYELSGQSCVSKSGGFNYTFMMQVARHGQNDYINTPPKGYYASATGADLAGIYLEIARQIRNTVAQQLASGEHMIFDSVYSYIRVNSSNPGPNNTTSIPNTNLSVISWDVDAIKVDSTFEVIYNISSVRAGYLPTNVASRSLIQYLDPATGTRKELYFPQTFVFVMDTLNSDLIRINDAVPIDHQQITVIIDTTHFSTIYAVDSIFIYYNSAGFITNFNDPSRRSFRFTGSESYLIDGLTENTLYYFTLSVRNVAGHHSTLIGDYDHGDTARTLFQTGQATALQLIYVTDTASNAYVPLLDFPFENLFPPDSLRYIGAFVTDAYDNPADDGTIVRFFRSNGEFLADLQSLNGFVKFGYIIRSGLDTLSGQVLNNASANDRALFRGALEGFQLILSANPVFPLNSNQRIQVTAGTVFPIYLFLVDIKTNALQDTQANVILTSSDPGHTSFDSLQFFLNPLGQGSTLPIHFSATTQPGSVAVFWVRSTRAQNNLQILVGTVINSKNIQGIKNNIFIAADNVQWIKVVTHQPARLDTFSVTDSLRDSTIYLDQNGTARLSHTVYAAGYDRFGNFNQLVPAKWTSSEPRFNILLNNATGYDFRVTTYGQGPLQIAYNGINGQSGTLTVKDKTSPQILKAWTKDVDGNGFLDQIVLSLSEGVLLNYAVMASASLSLVGKTDLNKTITYTIDTIKTTGQDILMILKIRSSGQFTDTDVLPTMTVSAGPTMIQDSSGNFLVPGIFTSITDSAGPVIDSAIFDNRSTSVKSDDRITVFFSEKIVAFRAMPRDSSHRVFYIDNPNTNGNKLTSKKTDFLFNPSPAIEDLIINNNPSVTLETELMTIIPFFDRIQIISNGIFSFLLDINGNRPHPNNRKIEIKLTSSGELIRDFITYPNPLVLRRDVMYVTYNLFESASNIKIYIFSSTGERVKSFSLEGNSDNDYINKYVDPQDPGKGLRTTKNFALWNGTNENGRWVGPGVYICNLFAKFITGQQTHMSWKIGVLEEE